ncbi:MAG TPA: hypothetical protein VED41_09530, partial [Solirubrobacteraceae bacterium]|nr:hypothetical protein [Solirubrobacteraceae bacterium]
MGRVGGGAIGPPLTLLVPGALVAVALVLSMGASSASAQLPQPHWSIASQSQPTRFEAGDGSDAYVVIARNDGAAPTGAGQVVSLTDTVPPGVTVTRVFAEGESADGSGQPSFEMNCPEEPEGRTVTCTYGEEATRLPVLPGTVMVMTVTVSIPAGVTALGENYASVSGGGAPGASVSEATTISPAPAPFGLSLFNLDSTEEDGKPDVQAGSHPYELTSTLA